jgi:hypothetical protein
MKAMKTTLFVVGLILLSTTAWAQLDCLAPDGFYTTSNGTILPGRSSEAWCTVSPPEYHRAGVPGNTENAMSWDGTSLATQWRFWGMQIDGTGAVLTYDGVNPTTGTGFRDYSTNYVGGQFWLAGWHTWSDGTDLFGNVTYMNVGARVSIVAGQVVGVTSNILITGQLVTCPNCVLEYSISNAIRVWDPTDPDPMPADYPGWECGTTGELFDICCIDALIVCDQNANEESTWGAIKEMYK